MSNVCRIEDARRARLSLEIARVVADNARVGLSLAYGYSPVTRPRVLAAVLECCLEPEATRQALGDLGEQF